MREEEGRKLVFLRSSTSRGAFRVAIIKGNPLGRVQTMAQSSYQKQTTEPKRLKGQGTSRNAKKLKFLYTSTYTRSVPRILSPSPSLPPLIHPHVRSDKVDVTRRKEKDIPSDETSERRAYKNFMNHIKKYLTNQNYVETDEITENHIIIIEDDN